MPPSDSYSSASVSSLKFIVVLGLPVLVAAWVAFEMATKPSMNNLNGEFWGGEGRGFLVDVRFILEGEEVVREECKTVFGDERFLMAI